MPEGARVVVREIGEGVLERIGLECEVPATLVITPYFRCHEVRGAQFRLRAELREARCDRGPGGDRRGAVGG